MSSQDRPLRLAQRRSSFFTREGTAGYVFIMPWLIGFLAFTLYPFVTSFYYALTDYNLFSQLTTFTGLANFRRLLADRYFWLALRVTFKYTLLSVPMRLIFALIVAMLLNRRSRMQGFYRVALYIPSIIGGSVAVAVMWRQLFTQNGVVNGILQSLGFAGNTAWLTNPKTALWTLVVLAVWQFGSSMLIFLAGLKEIPTSYYEAAIVDGAGGLAKFFRITLPLLTPTIFFNLINQMINGFTAFNQSFIITQGKPLNLTRFYAVYVYETGFTHYEMGYASALAWVMLLIIGILTALVFRSSRAWVHYEGGEQ